MTILKSRNKARERWAFSIVVFFCMNVSAYAYIPPSEFLVKTYIKKRAEVAQIQIKSLIVSSQPGEEGSSRFYETLLIDVVHGKAVSKITSESGKLLGQKKIGLGQSESGIVELLFSPHFTQVAQQLKSMGVKLLTEQDLLKLSTEKERYSAENLSLKRNANQIFWVVGAQQQEEKNEVWFLKDQFLLAQLSSERGRRGQSVGYVFDENRFFQEFPYPRRIEVKVDEKPFLKAELSEMKVTLKSEKGGLAKDLAQEDGLQDERVSGSEADGFIRSFWKIMR